MPTVEEWISESKDYTNDVVELDEIKVTKITPQLKAELEKFKAAKRLSMVACDLKSFENFPVLEELEELDLTDNKIKGEELRNIPLLAQLRELSLSCNPINNIQDIKTLTRFNKSLESLFLDESPLAKSNKNYRKDIFQMYILSLYRIGGALTNVDLEDREGKQIAEDSYNDEDDDQDEEDDVQGDIIDDQDEEGDFQPKKQKGNQGSGKKQAEEDDDDDDDDEDDEDDDQEDFEEDQDDDEEEEASQPQKRVKRN